MLEDVKLGLGKITLNAPLGIFTDEALDIISHANPGRQIERDARGRLIMSPVNTGDGCKSAEALGQLRDLSKRVGGKAFDAATGFTMPDGSVLSPDAAWIDPEQLRTADRSETFWNIVPAIVIEVRSISDSWRDTMEKIDRFYEYGARYAVAIDPQTREVNERGSGTTFDLQLDFDAIIDA